MHFFHGSIASKLSCQTSRQFFELRRKAAYVGRLYDRNTQRASSAQQSTLVTSARAVASAISRRRSNSQHLTRITVAVLRGCALGSAGPSVKEGAIACRSTVLADKIFQREFTNSFKPYRLAQRPPSPNKNNSAAVQTGRARRPTVCVQRACCSSLLYLPLLASMFGLLA